MIQMIITEEELRKALADIEQAKERGFTHTEAFLSLVQVGRTIGDDRLVYRNRLDLKAGPTPDLDYGSITSEMISWYKFENGQVINT